MREARCWRGSRPYGAPDPMANTSRPSSSITRDSAGSSSHDPDLSKHRWTFDDARDLAFVRADHERLDRFLAEKRMSMYAVLRIVAYEPAPRDLNQGTESDEGYRISVERERAEGGAADSE